MQTIELKFISDIQKIFPYTSIDTTIIDDECYLGNVLSVIININFNKKHLRCMRTYPLYYQISEKYIDFMKSEIIEIILNTVAKEI